MTTPARQADWAERDARLILGIPEGVSGFVESVAQALRAAERRGAGRMREAIANMLADEEWRFIPEQVRRFPLSSALPADPAATQEPKT